MANGVMPEVSIPVLSTRTDYPKKGQNGRRLQNNREKNRTSSHQRGLARPQTREHNGDIQGVSHEATPNRSEKESISEKKKESFGSFRIRRLTCTECERLQGFPDDWTKNGMEHCEQGKNSLILEK
jgi:site-specific DNA-cytosine methylase